MSSRLSKHQGKVSQTLWSTTTITTSLSSDRDQLTTVHTKGLHKGSLSILNLRRGDLRGLFHVSKIGTLNAWGESLSLHYNSFSCFTSACHMTSVWSTSSDLSYSIETILTLVTVTFMYLRHAGVALQKEHNHRRWDHPSAQIPAEPHYHSMWCAQRCKCSWGFCSSGWSHHHCMQWNALGWSPLVTSQTQTWCQAILSHLTKKRRDWFCPSLVANHIQLHKHCSAEWSVPSLQ